MTPKTLFLFALVFVVLPAGCGNGGGDDDGETDAGEDVQAEGLDVDEDDVPAEQPQDPAEDPQQDPVDDPQEEGELPGDVVEDTVEEQDDAQDMEEEEELGPLCGNCMLEEPDEECDDCADGDPWNGCKDDCTLSCRREADCDDGDPCTDGECRDEDGCMFEPIGLADVYDIEGGRRHTCAIIDPDHDYKGNVRCWGSNEFGQLGDGTTSDSYDPVDVSGLGENVVAFALGDHHGCAIVDTDSDNQGTVHCWGLNSSGQLGDGTNTDSNVPVAVAVLSDDIYKIDAGFAHTCATAIGGNMYCWGNNAHGQLGIGTTVSHNTPQLTGLTGNAGEIGAGGNHTCATVGGVLKCWGSNGNGQLGDGTMIDRHSPPAEGVDFGGPIGTYIVACGTSHTCAMLAGFNVECWGANDTGQLGDGTRTQRLTPVPARGMDGGVSRVVAGNGFTCVRMTYEAVECWGDNSWGQVGDMTSITRLEHEPVHELMDEMDFNVTAGSGHACAIKDPRTAYCWGENFYGQLGNRTTSRKPPVGVEGLGGAVEAVSAGGWHTCAVTASGGVQCWGSNNDGQIGNNDDQRLTPDGARYVFDLYTEAAAVGSGNYHACAVTDTGSVKCWGQNDSGQVGDGTTETRVAPVEIDPGGVAVSVTGGGSHSCAMLDEGSMTCWGENGSGQIGNGSTDDALTPSAVTGLASNATFACAGVSHSCALLDTGGVMCWGANDEGQLGNGTTTPSSVPVVVAGLTAGATALACGKNHSCAVQEGGVKCWGNNEFGSLGNGGTEDQLEPTAVSDPGDDVIAIGCGDEHSCAILESGDVVCWGANTDNGLGDGTFVNSSVPVSVDGLDSSASAITCGGAHTCALLEYGNVRCWGHDQYGQVSGVNPGHAHVVYCE